MAGAIVATMISLAIYSQAYTINSLMRMTTRSTEDKIKTDVKIVHASFNSSASDTYLVASVKNVGLRSISPQELIKMDVYAGQESCRNIFMFCGTSKASECWDYMLVDPDANGLWDPGETVILRIHGLANTNGHLCVKVVLPNGVGHEVYAYV